MVLLSFIPLWRLLHQPSPRGHSEPMTNGDAEQRGLIVLPVQPDESKATHRTGLEPLDASSESRCVERSRALLPLAPCSQRASREAGILAQPSDFSLPTLSWLRNRRHKSFLARSLCLMKLQDPLPTRLQTSSFLSGSCGDSASRDTSVKRGESLHPRGNIHRQKNAHLKAIPYGSTEPSDTGRSR